MGTYSDTSTSFPVIATVEAPASSGDPASIESLLSATVLAKIGDADVVQVEITADATDIYVRDDADEAGRPDDYVIAPVTISCVNKLDGIFLQSSGAAADARLLILCHRGRLA
jgi:hypothetical protein